MERETTSIENDQLIFWSDLPEIRSEENFTSLVNIPSDDDSRFTLNITTHSGAFGDAFITMNDTILDENFTFIKGLRLRSSAGGGFNPFITGEFLSIISNFDLTPFEFDEEKPKDKINPNSAFKVTKNPDSETRLSIVGIQDDDNEPGFIDIYVLNNGDTKLRIRNKTVNRDLERTESSGEMLFKSKENGGKNPIMAETLTRIADRIANAKTQEIK